MKIGVCAKPHQALKAREAGFEYIEVSCNWVRERDRDALLEARAQLDGAGLEAESFNCFFPGDFDLYGGGKQELLSIVSSTLERAAFLGCRTAVIGSGKARSLREGIDRPTAAAKFCEAVAQSAELAAEFGITVAVEPLREAETNFINRVPEGVEIAKRVNMPNVGTMVDFYHFFCNGEELSELDAAAKYFVHAHMARPNEDRLWPQEENLATIALWAEKLKATGYDGRLTLECRWNDMFDEKISEARQNMSAFKSL